MQRSNQGIFVTGTDTHVGKTWVGQAVLRHLMAQGIRAIPRKPVESGWQGHNPRHSDAHLLSLAAGSHEPLARVCPNRLAAPLSPVRAAQLEGRSVLLESLIQQCQVDYDANNEETFLLVEGAGGFLSPLAEDALNADLARALALPLLLVAADRLGCINHVLLTLLAAQQYGVQVRAIVLSQTSPETAPEQMDNAAELRTLCQVPVFEVAYQQTHLPEALIHSLL